MIDINVLKNAHMAMAWWSIHCIFSKRFQNTYIESQLWNYLQTTITFEFNLFEIIQYVVYQNFQIYCFEFNLHMSMLQLFT